MLLYRCVGYEYEVRLHNKRTYLWVYLSAFVGGFFQAMAATGAGSSIVAILLISGYPQKMCSATARFLAFFFAATTIVHAVLHSEVTIEQFGWFFGISFLLGGALTVLLYRKIEQSSQESRVLMLLISAICLICVFSVIPNIMQTASF